MSNQSLPVPSAAGQARGQGQGHYSTGHSRKAEEIGNFRNRVWGPELNCLNIFTRVTGTNNGTRKIEDKSSPLFVFYTGREHIFEDI